MTGKTDAGHETKTTETVVEKLTDYIAECDTETKVQQIL